MNLQRRFIASLSPTAKEITNGGGAAIEMHTSENGPVISDHEDLMKSDMLCCSVTDVNRKRWRG